MKQPLRRRLAAIALAGGLVLTACGDDEPDAEFSTQDDDTSSPSDDKNDSKTEDGGDETTTDSRDTIGIDFPDPDDVVADATFTIPGSHGDQVRVGVAGIRANDSYMELRLVFTPLYEPDRGVPSVFDMLGDNSRLFRLIDRANLKEYRILLDESRQDYKTDPVGAKAETGESVGYQVFFAPPEDEIEVIDVIINPAWPAFEDVPITFEV